MTPQRNQIELRAVDPEALLAPDHATRTVWSFVQSVDRATLYTRIKSVAGRGGAPAIDRQLDRHRRSSLVPRVHGALQASMQVYTASTRSSGG